MGKAGRTACIFTPMLLTLASFVCILLINLGGYSKGSSTLNDLYFFEANFSDFTSNSSSSILSTILEAARESGDIADVYHINLWNYCNGTSNGTISYCSDRHVNFWFNPISVWNIDGLVNSTASELGVSSLVSDLSSSNITALEDEVLDSSTRKALKTYQTVSKWMFAAYFAALWVLVATIVIGCFAVCTRFLGFITWLFSIIATVLVAGASVTATVLFSVLLEALKSTLSGHNIHLSIHTHTLVVTWLATAFSLLATLFWLFSACCCSGASNPHHYSNRGPPASEFAAAGAAGGWLARRRDRRNNNNNLNAEKGVGQYEAVHSPYVSGGAGGEADNVPLTQVAAPPAYGRTGAAHYRDQSGDLGEDTGYDNYGGRSGSGEAMMEYYGGGSGREKHHGGGGAFEPYRHG